MRHVGSCFVACASALLMALAGCSDGEPAQAVTPDAGTPNTTVVDVAPDTGPEADVACVCTQAPVACGKWECVAGDCQLVSDAPGTSCDDGLACTVGETCIAGEEGSTCSATTTTCDDGNFCNGPEVCTASGCGTGTALVCMDEDPCNGTEICSPSVGCVPGAPLACGDEDPCNGVEACQAGVGCQGQGPANCDDGSACTVDSCEPGTGCVHGPSGEAGCCTSTADCDDQNDCTQDSCGPGGACVNTAFFAPCDDGDPCTGGDACASGQCGGTPRGGCAILCKINHGPDGLGDCPIDLARLGQGPLATGLDLGFAWTGDAKLIGLIDRACGGGVCGLTILPAGGQFGPGGHAAFPLPAVLADWDAQGGLSLAPLIVEDAPLSGASIAADVIIGPPNVLGLRLHGDPGGSTTLVAYDLVAVAGTASLTAGVVSPPARTPLIVTTDAPCGETICWDGNPCTQDLCNGGVCTHPIATGPCDDDNPCTADSQCDSSGTCAPTQFAAAGTLCSGLDKCNDVGTCDAAGECVSDPSLAPDCDKNDGPCADSTCDKATGGCLIDVRTGSTCDDGDNCTEIDVCDSSGSCGGAEKDCHDSIPCTLDSCSGGTCSHTTDHAACADGFECSENTCDVALGCITQVSASPCDDGDACTVGDTCITVSLCKGDPAPGCGCQNDQDCEVLEDADLCNGTLVCDDGHCHVDPDTVVECPYEGFGCKTDWQCKPETGKCSGTKQTCDDLDACTEDSCSPVLGCQHTLTDGCAANWICEVSGSKDDVVVCPVRIARELEGAVVASSADITLRWDGSLTLENAQDNACFGTVCFDYDLVGCGAGPCVTEKLSPTGHSVILAPEKMSDWTDWLSFFIFHLGAPDTALSGAYLDDDGDPVGNPLVFEVRFHLNADVPSATPARVRLDGAALQPASGQALVVRVVTTSTGRTIVTSE